MSHSQYIPHGEEFNTVANSYFYADDVSEHFGAINTIPLVPEMKHIKRPRFYEEFYIVGVDKMTLMSLGKGYETVRPSLLYNYPNSPEHQERHKIIKDF